MTDALERLRFAIGALPAALARFSDADASAPQGPGRWAKKEVVGHLIDSASNNHQRFVRGQLQAGQTFPRYDQDDWVRVQQYRAAPWAELIDLWRLYNAHLARVAVAMTAEARRVTCRVADGDPVTLDALFVDYVDHLEHHLRRMLGAWPATGDPT
ncbi:MAG: DinB family protein [Planctomycetes bacterium]|nr:DinB family protein [Planctomycetota bacterium]